MNQTNRRKDGSLIKKAVKKALPLANIGVKGGKGTAWGWWHIEVDHPKPSSCSCTFETWGVRITCQPCKDLYRNINNLSQKSAIESGAQIYYSYDEMDSSMKIADINTFIELV